MVEAFIADREAIFIARSSAAEERVEAALKEAGIPFSVSLQATEQNEPGAVCYLAMVYKVPTRDAARSRRLLVSKGLGGDVIEP